MRHARGWGAMIRLSSLRVSFFAAVLAFTSCGQSPPLTITPGILELCVAEGGAQMRIKEETMLIPRPQPEWESFGFALATGEDSSVVIRTRHYLPGVPARIPSEFISRGWDPEDALTGLEFPAIKVNSARWFSFNVDSGDPLGTYRVEIIADDQLVQTLEFEVVGNAEAVSKQPEPPACPEPAA